MRIISKATLGVWLVACLLLSSMPALVFSHGAEFIPVSMRFKEDGTYTFQFPNDFSVQIPTNRLENLKDRHGELEAEVGNEFTRIAPELLPVLRRQIHVYFDEQEVTDPISFTDYEGNGMSGHDEPTELPDGKTKVPVTKYVVQSGMIPTSATTFACFIDGGIPLKVTIQDVNEAQPVLQEIAAGARSQPYHFKKKAGGIPFRYLVIGLVVFVIFDAVVMLALFKRRRLANQSAA
ncbi:hypothetical protein IT570_11425 [Candidatus Sumerlaeota bacterium]|nr:hypothetical protein [Candidatus Sumerlaeota bacterium]